MIFADVMVRFSTIDVMVHDKLPCGAAGLKVQFRFLDSAWNDLKKIAVFRNKSQIFDVAIVDNCATIPQELLTKVLDVIEVGVYGTNADQVLAIPTLWGSLGRIESAANPSGDAAMDPTLPYWALLQEQVDMLENTILGNDDPESVRVSALRTSGGEMSGDIEMCGNTITGLGTPTNDTDAATKGYVQSAAAPAGYGLGEYATNISYKSLESVFKSGKSGLYRGQAITELTELGNQWVWLDIRIESATYGIAYGCTYGGNKFIVRFASGVVQPLDWENPPMELGKGYRTTERWQGKAVYTKLIDFGALPNIAEKTYNHGLGDISPLSISMFCTNGSWAFTLPSDSADEPSVIFNTSQITLATTIDRSGYNGYATIRYCNNWEG